MDRELLIAIAKRVLECCVGDGYWHLHNESPPKKIVDPILGLSEGDTVYWYNVEEEKIVADRVVAIVDGVGYTFYMSPFYGPMLEAISWKEYNRTIDDAIEHNRETIERDISFWQERVDTLERLKSLINRKKPVDLLPQDHPSNS